MDNGTTAQVAATGAVASTLTIGSTIAGSTVQMLPGGDLTVFNALTIGTGGTLQFSGGGTSGGTLHTNAILDNGRIVFDGSLDHSFNFVVTGSGQ